MHAHPILRNELSATVRQDQLRAAQAARLARDPGRRSPRHRPPTPTSVMAALRLTGRHRTQLPAADPVQVTPRG
jgi:hypothetical protein